MHKLDRGAIDAPTCLRSYQYPMHTWNDVTHTDKQQIRQSLEQMQGARCAYCECRIYSDGHIEHFRRKNPHHFPDLSFDWSNLFLSCGSVDHCGHYKDSPRNATYEPNDIIKPDIVDPDSFFYFYSTGWVSPRSGLSKAERHMAEETIRVFNLTSGDLVASRRRAINIYTQNEPDMLETLMQFDPDVREQFISAEIDHTRDDPHATVIRHLFEKAY